METSEKLILAFDPGGTTGYAYISFSVNNLTLIESGQIPGGLQGFIAWWKDKEPLGSKNPIIVCESFTLREGIRGVNLDPCYVIGALEVLSGDEEVVYQPPNHKVFCNNDVLVNLGMWLRGQQHARDAVRHAIAYLRNTEKHKPTLDRGWPDE